MKLTILCEEFIDASKRPMTFGKLPVLVSTPDVPVIAVDKWQNEAGHLKKKFSFRRPDDRREFVVALMAYEDEVGHHAVLTSGAGFVIVDASTHGIDQVTELDTEYSKFADTLFRDIVYNS